MPRLPLSASQPNRISDSSVELIVRHIAASDDAPKAIDQESTNVGHDGELP